MSEPHDPNATSRTSGGTSGGASGGDRPSGGDPIADRRAKLARLRDELHVDPFGRRITGLSTLAAARALFDPAKTEDDRPAVRVAGRIVLHRDIGKLIFMTLRDHTGDLQVAISKKSVDDPSFQLAKLLDLGDIVVIAGRVGATKTGEVTVWAQSDAVSGAPPVEIASKSLVPPPEKWKGLQDSELRYRQRYVDLWANPDVMRTMQLRSRVVEEVRRYLRDRGFLEVETPILQPIHGGAAARPFITHHNTLDMNLYLRIAPELYLKRLLVGGLPKVFEIGRVFRNEGVSPRHNPEFTMLEIYEAFGSWESMADLVEEMIAAVAQHLLGTLQIEHKNAAGEVTRTINLTRPWRRVRMDALVQERTGWRFSKEALPPAEIDRLRQQNPGKDLKFAGSPAEQLVEVYEKLIEPTLIDPCFVTHVPSVAIPLARENKDDPYFADVYELAINGVEIGPGYTELNDPDAQERHFRHQVGDREEQQQVDEDFLNALRVGMPPAGGLGLGIDRLLTLLTGEPALRDVILFPLMRPQ